MKTKVLVLGGLLHPIKKAKNYLGFCEHFNNLGERVNYSVEDGFETFMDTVSS